MVFPLMGPETRDCDDPAQLSVCVTVYTTGLWHCPLVAGNVSALGHDITGGSASLTVTVNEHVAVRPIPSVAVNSTVLTPTGKFAPLTRPPVNATVGVPQLSLAPGVE